MSLIKLTGGEKTNVLEILPVKTKQNCKIPIDLGQDSSYLRGHQMYETKFDDLKAKLVAINNEDNTVVLLNDVKSFTTDPSNVSSGSDLQKLNDFLTISNIINKA